MGQFQIFLLVVFTNYLGILFVKGKQYQHQHYYSYYYQFYKKIVTRLLHERIQTILSEGSKFDGVFLVCCLVDEGR